jgi:molybdate transport system ATP-binding protein
MRLRIDIELALQEFTLAIDIDRTANAVGIVGPSGAGKTTLLEIVAGLRQPDRGTIALDGRDLTRLPARDRRIGYVPQDETLFPHMNVRSNVTYGITKAENVDELAQLLAIDSLLDRSVAKLSGGERRRVAITRALLTNPAALLLDEPLAGIDPALGARMLELLRDIRTCVPIVLVSHAREEIAAVCDDVIELDRGRVV